MDRGRDRAAAVGRVSTLIPMVVLVPADTVDTIDRITAERWEQIPADARRDIENLMVQNGWTRWAMVAGSMLTKQAKA